MAKLTVMPEHIELVRLAALERLAECSEWLADQSKEARGWIEEGKADHPFDHVDGPLMAVSDQTTLVRQLGQGKPAVATELTCERTEQLIDTLEGACKLGSEHLSELSEAPAVVSWAAGEIVRLQAIEGPEAVKA